MNFLKSVISNGYLPILPILIWNIILTPKLPAQFQPGNFNSNVPFAILLGENIFRFIIFSIPLAIKLNVRSKAGRTGLRIYLFGIVLYFSSWVLLICFPDSFWANNLFGFAAPAYTPVIWLIGIGYMADSYFFNLAYKKWNFILPGIAFSIFHITHTIFVYYKYTAK